MEIYHEKYIKIYEIHETDTKINENHENDIKIDENNNIMKIIL